jgi:hypothetical protein
MQKLIQSLSDWPIIIQGMAGSALFAILMYMGQKAASALPKVVASLSKERRRSYLTNRRIRLEALLNSGNVAASTHHAAILWYRASRDLIKALIWLTLGLMFEGVLGIFGVVGYLGCLYHLFFALSVVRPIRGEEAKNREELARVNEKLKNINDP